MSWAPLRQDTIDTISINPTAKSRSGDLGLTPLTTSQQPAPPYIPSIVAPSFTPMDRAQPSQHGLSRSMSRRPLPTVPFQPPFPPPSRPTLPVPEPPPIPLVERSSSISKGKGKATTPRESEKSFEEEFGFMALVDDDAYDAQFSATERERAPQYLDDRDPDEREGLAQDQKRRSTVRRKADEKASRDIERVQMSAAEEAERVLWADSTDTKEQIERERNRLSSLTPPSDDGESGSDAKARLTEYGKEEPADAFPSREGGQRPMMPLVDGKRLVEARGSADYGLFDVAEDDEVPLYEHSQHPGTLQSYPLVFDEPKSLPGAFHASPHQHFTPSTAGTGHPPAPHPRASLPPQSIARQFSYDNFHSSSTLPPSQSPGRHFPMVSPLPATSATPHRLPHSSVAPPRRADTGNFANAFYSGGVALASATETTIFQSAAAVTASPPPPRQELSRQVGRDNGPSHLGGIRHSWLPGSIAASPVPPPTGHAAPPQGFSPPSWQQPTPYPTAYTPPSMPFIVPYPGTPFAPTTASGQRIAYYGPPPIHAHTPGPSPPAPPAFHSTPHSSIPSPYTPNNAPGHQLAPEQLPAKPVHQSPPSQQPPEEQKPLFSFSSRSRSDSKLPSHPKPSISASPDINPTSPPPNLLPAPPQPIANYASLPDSTSSPSPSQSASAYVTYVPDVQRPMSTSSPSQKGGRSESRISTSSAKRRGSTTSPDSEETGEPGDGRKMSMLWGWT